MPEQLLSLSKSYNSYNEILLLEKDKTPTDIDKSIDKLKRGALYCVDEIRQQDIESAKRNGTGIVLVKSSDYIYDNLVGDNNYLSNDLDYNYFDGFYEREKFERNR